MELQGEVIEIIYKNELNSYCIAVLEIDKDIIKKNKKEDSDQMYISDEFEKINNIDKETTIVGYLPFVNVGDTLKVIGKFVEHQEYGRQFKVDTF